MPAPTPLVTIGLPVRNGGSELDRALASLAAQTVTDVEVLVSDNASSDATPDVAAAWAAADERVRWTRHERDVGAIANFNSVLSRARGRYFMWAAHDDVWEERFLEAALHLLEDPAVALAFCAFDNVDASGERVRSYPQVFDLVSDDRTERLRTYLAQPGDAGKANLVYGVSRRAVLQAVGGMRCWGRGEWGADMLSVFRLLAEGRLALADEVLFHKQVAPPVAPARATGPQRVVGKARQLADWHGYCLGYARIVRQLDGLDVGERALLLRELARTTLQQDLRFARDATTALATAGRR